VPLSNITVVNFFFIKCENQVSRIELINIGCAKLQRKLLGEKRPVTYECVGQLFLSVMFMNY